MIVFLVFALFLISIPVMELYFGLKWIALKGGKRKPSAGFRRFVLIINILFLLEAWGVYDAFLIEPNRLTETHIPLRNAKLHNPNARIRIVQITDLHIEGPGPSPVLARITKRVAELKPDFIALTGDFMNNDTPEAHRILGAFLKSLHARTASYAIRGNWDYDNNPDAELRAAGVVSIDHHIKTHYIAGARINFAGTVIKNLRRRLSAPENRDTVNVVLEHYPDYIYDVSGPNVDYYFCGHTHGGQVRLPFYGALTTLAKYGKRFEMGPYKVNGTYMYISRGVGMTGMSIFKIRFNCPPELVVYDIVSPRYQKPF